MPNDTRKALSAAQQRMCRAIQNDTGETSRWTGRAEISPRVMHRMARVPRHRFMGLADDDPAAPEAYANRPRPIGHLQTISQPYIVAIMSDLLDLQAGDRVLEIGTGCGYQTAVLAGLCKHVYSIERIAALSADAAPILDELGCGNVSLMVGDGFAGWPEHAPFDAIIVTAAPREVPQALLDQLAPGGRLVIPVGETGGAQMLHRQIRREDDEIVDAGLLPVAFVPMIGDVAS